MTHKQVKNDLYGNPRVVVWFYDLLPETAKNLPHDEQYAIAKKNANKIGGRVYRGKDFGGGFVFQCYSISELYKHIDEIINQ